MVKRQLVIEIDGSSTKKALDNMKKRISRVLKSLPVRVSFKETKIKDEEPSVSEGSKA